MVTINSKAKTKEDNERIGDQLFKIGRSTSLVAALTFRDVLFVNKYIFGALKGYFGKTFNSKRKIYPLLKVSEF